MFSGSRFHAILKGQWNKCKQFPGVRGGRLKGQLACSNQLGIWARAMTLFCCQFFAPISPSHSQRELRIKHHIYDRAVCGFIPLQRFYTIQNVIQSSATRFFNAFTTKYKQNCHSVILGIILMLLSLQF